jgi:AcrR family transcriptional regulator
MAAPQRTADDTRNLILETAERQLRRHGLAKMTVVDIAQASGMSHANVYRFFPTKAAIFDAITERWLGATERMVSEIAARPVPAAERLEECVIQLHRSKRRKVEQDPEIFDTYCAIARGCREVFEVHRTRVVERLESIVRDGVAAGEFQVADTAAAVASLRHATLKFHDPRLIAESLEEPTEEQARRVVRLIIAGLRAGLV